METHTQQISSTMRHWCAIIIGPYEIAKVRRKIVIINRDKVGKGNDRGQKPPTQQEKDTRAAMRKRKMQEER